MNWEVLERLKKIREEKRRLKEEERLRGDRSRRMEDLLITLHRVGKVELPIPNLFAHSQMEKYFGGLERIDLANEQHVGAIVWFLKNQDDIAIANYSRAEVIDKIHQEMRAIPLDRLQEYIICIEEIFLAIKKKSILSERSILQQALEILEKKEDPGTGSSSPS